MVVTLRKRKWAASWQNQQNQTGPMSRLIRDFARHTGHFVGFVMRRLICRYLLNFLYLAIICRLLNSNSFLVCFWMFAVMVLFLYVQMSRQTVENQIRLLRVCTVCHSVCIFWVHYFVIKPNCSTFRIVTANFSCVRIVSFQLTWAFRLIVSPSSTIFKDLLQNRLAYQSQISYGASVGWGNESLFAGSGSHDQDGHHAHIW